MEDDLKIVVVLLTWQRLNNLASVLNKLHKQSYRNFDVVISNGNLKEHAIAKIEKYAQHFSNKGLNVFVRHDGNSLKTFRRLHVGKDLAEAGYDVVLFIDDDVTIPTSYISRSIAQYEPKTYKSGFAWRFFNRGRNYYKFRQRVTNHREEIHYCGTGFSMIDASIFLDNDLINNAPKAAYTIEDLWLSYFVYHKPGWSLQYMDSPGVALSGGDSVALYRQVQRSEINKADFLRQLVAMGWDLPA